VDLARRPLSKTPVLLHVRAGLEALLLDELAAEVADPSARMVGRGRVSTTLDGPLSTLFAARTFLHLGFPLPPEPVAQGDVASAVARSLTSATSWDIMRALTRGPVRYRLEWGDRGRTRGQTARVAGAVQEARPELHNDSRDALWQVVVSERRGRVFLELWPRVQDPRFVYRRRTLPASSHPTIAAAIARVGGARPSDVVWDPFVGSGIELCERAHLGPFARLYGTDLSAEAIAAARENLRAAGITAARLEVGDARHAHPPHGLSLVLTNPPFGRRVLERDAVGPLLSAVIEKSSRSLEKGGRLVWISPLKDETVAMAESHGFRVASRTMVDVGGLDGELQSFVLGEPDRRHRTT
jgi:predicted RNA methylase